MTLTSRRRVAPLPLLHDQLVEVLEPAQAHERLAHAVVVLQARGVALEAWLALGPALPPSDHDPDDLAALRATGTIAGVIIGRALYDGRLTARDALAAA